MRKYLTGGAILGVLVTSLTLSAYTTGPGVDTSGEAYTKLFGVTVDHLEIPPGTPLPVDRIMRGFVATIALAVVVGTLVGGFGGCVWWKVRADRVPQPGVNDLPF